MRTVLAKHLKPGDLIHNFTGLFEIIEIEKEEDSFGDLYVFLAKGVTSHLRYSKALRALDTIEIR